MFRLALAGSVPPNGRFAERIDETVRQLRAFLSPSGGDDDELRLLVSSAYTGTGWLDWVRRSGCEVGGCGSGEESEWDALCGEFVRIHTPLRYLIGSAVCNTADLLLVLWNEDVTERGGATWELMQLALRKKTPFLWISTRNGAAYWPEDTCYEPYRREKLRRLCELYGSVSTQPSQSEEKAPLLFLGRRLRARYMRRHRARLEGGPAAQDRMLLDEPVFAGENEREAVRLGLLERFRAFDSSAIELNERYQAVLYCCAVLPFFTSLLLALGFYTETVFGFLLPRVSWLVWSTLAVLGFLAHGLLTLYLFRVQRSAAVLSWQNGFLRNRSIAELLRVLIHFAPFSIDLDLRRLSGGDRETFITIRRIADVARRGVRQVERGDMDEALSYLMELLDDQLAYHRASERRYAGIVDALERGLRRASLTASAVLIVRSFLQGGLIMIQLSGTPLPEKPFLSALANMTAMLLPAWAAYFSSKLTVCSFQYNRDNDQRMCRRLGEIRGRLEALRKLRRDIPLEALQEFGENLAEIMLVQDTFHWAQRYRSVSPARKTRSEKGKK